MFVQYYWNQPNGNGVIYAIHVRHGDTDGSVVSMVARPACNESVWIVPGTIQP